MSSVLCNQVLDEKSDAKYLQTRSRGQRSCIETLKNSVQKTAIEITEVPYVDTEVTGIYGLRFFHSVAHKPVAKTATNPIDSKKLTVFGGKGGVGKVSCILNVEMNKINTYILISLLCVAL